MGSQQVPSVPQVVAQIGQSPDLACGFVKLGSSALTPAAADVNQAKNLLVVGSQFAVCESTFEESSKIQMMADNLLIEITNSEYPASYLFPCDLQPINVQAQ